MNKEKTCPLFLMSPAFETTKGCECRKDLCAWWHFYTNQCAILTLAGSNMSIEKKLEKVVKK